MFRSNDPRYFRIWQPFPIATFGGSLLAGGRLKRVSYMGRTKLKIRTFYLEKHISCYFF